MCVHDAQTVVLVQSFVLQTTGKLVNVARELIGMIVYDRTISLEIASV